MAFLRKDTPLANTPDPGKGNISKSTIVPTKIDPTKMKLVDSKSVSRDSINNGRVVGRITESINTFKGNANTPARKPVAATPVRKPVASSVSAKTTVKPTAAEDTKIVRTKTFTPSKEDVTPIKTKSVGVMASKPEIKAPADASKLASRGDNRTWQEKRKEEVSKKDYLKWRQGDETMSEWKTRSTEASKKVAEKNKKKGNGFLRATTSGRGGSGGGGCHSC